jgi:hypothetical protein
MFKEFIFETMDDDYENDPPVNLFKFLDNFSDQEFEDGTVYQALSTHFNLTPLQIKDLTEQYLEQRPVV